MLIKDLGTFIKVMGERTYNVLTNKHEDEPEVTMGIMIDDTPIEGTVVCDIVNTANDDEIVIQKKG